MHRTALPHFKPFSLRHARLIAEKELPAVANRVRTRLWSTLMEFNQPDSYAEPDNPTWFIRTTEMERASLNYVRLTGRKSADSEETARWDVEHGGVPAVMDVLECFLDYIPEDRRPLVQTWLNDTFRDFAEPWRLSDGRVYLVDNAFVEDEVLAEASPLLANAGFFGAKQEFQRARDAYVDGNHRDAIFYAGASVESSFKAALGQSSKVGLDLAQAYANAGLLFGLPKGKGQAVQKVLIPTAILRNELAGHGQGHEVVDIPPEYGQLAISFAAAIHVFLAHQHLRQLEASQPKPKEIPTPLASTPPAAWDDDDIPF